MEIKGGVILLVKSIVMLIIMLFTFLASGQDAKPKLTPAPKPPATQPQKPKSVPPLKPPAAQPPKPILATPPVPAPCNTPSGLASGSITANTATVSWTAVSGAQSYNLQWQSSSAGNWDNFNTTSLAVRITSLSSSTTYQYRVQAVCSSGSSNYSIQASFTTQADQPPAPSLSAPIQKLVNDMVFIPGGTFTMGCTPEQGSDCWIDEKPTFSVTLSSYSMGRYEVTQAQWRTVMGSNPSHFSGCDNCPVEMVSWNDVQDFIKKLNQMTGRNFRLPTEAEWEYAARGGTTTKFHTGNCLSTSQANYDGNYPAQGCSKEQYRQKTVPVGSFSPNGYGLYDMSGNVWEWCSDWYGEDYYSSSPATNPKGPGSGELRVVRGGSWDVRARRCRVSGRVGLSPDFRLYHGFGFFNGFRLARD